MYIFKSHFFSAMAHRISRTALFLLCFCQLGFCFSQRAYQFSLSTSRYICEKAEATVEINGTNASDTISVSWSNGITGLRKIYDLTEGNYSVSIEIRHTDTLTHITDTTLYFSIEKELCGVSVDKYFSPNDDNYHDKMGITNVQYHPNFELSIFNKWGQQVHSQQKEYTPWDGKWNGISLPDGTYYYVFFYDAGEKTKLVKGDVTIIR